MELREEVLTTREACKILKVSRKTLYKLVREGKVPGRKVGKDWRFLRSDLLRYVQGQ